MDSFALRRESQRREILQEAANSRNVLSIIIEKDFWVCWTLKRLYAIPELSAYLTFKGGTSLSKAYGLIERFSEDIDLTISRDAPYISVGENPMEEGISGKERGRRTELLRQNAALFVQNRVLPMLEQAIQKALVGLHDWQVQLDEGDPERQTILFFYPKTLSYPGYIKPSVRLEFGARGEAEPHENKAISPYVAEIFPQIFPEGEVSVPTLAAERSFWEKVTILHALHHGARLRDRMSRHYYDTFMMTQKGVADMALGNVALLDQVVRNKSLLFRDAKASYETARLGSLRLVPKEEFLPVLKKDYAAMNEMFLGSTPDFAAIMTGLEELEERINRS